MAAQDLEHYLENADEFNTLSDDDKARLFAGGTLQGETDTSSAEPPAEPEISETPAAEPTPEPEPTAADEPVLLAKDGKHTIPYQELLDAREQMKQWEQIARENAALVESLKHAKPEPVAVAPEQQPVTDVDALERAAIDAMMEGDSDKALQLRSQINAELRRQAEETARVSITHELTARETQRLFDSAVEKAVTAYPFLDSTSADGNPEAIKEVVEWRDFNIAKGMSPADALLAAVNRVGPLYAPKPEPVTEPAAKPAAAIAKPTPKVPTSLSEIPAGAAAPHDEAAAVREMSGMNLMNKFAGKSPEQIMELMSRVI